MFRLFVMLYVFDLNQRGWEGSGVFWSSGFYHVITPPIIFEIFSLERKGLTQSKCVYPVALSDERGVSRHVGDHPCALLREALKLLHGAACDREWDNIKEERNNAAGVQAKGPWELFTDRTIRWQLLTIFLLNAAQQLNGINAVCTQRQCPPPDSSLPPSVSIARETHTKAAEGFFLFFKNVFYRFTSTQITCSSKQAFPVTKYLTWPLAPAPANASQL